MAVNREAPSKKASRIETDPHLLKRCDNPACDRRTTKGVEFCCMGCAAAHAGGYETHEDGPLGHSAGCDERHAARSAR